MSDIAPERPARLSRRLWCGLGLALCVALGAAASAPVRTLAYRAALAHLSPEAAVALFEASIAGARADGVSARAGAGPRLGGGARLL